MVEPRKEMLYHTVDEDGMDLMAEVRQKYYALYEVIMELVPEGRPRSIALTDLESSLMRSIQAIALEYGDPQLLGS